MKIAMAQTSPVTGDLEANVHQIVEDIRKAKSEGADFILFPETSITGYCCGARFEEEDFIQYNKKFLEEIIAKEVPVDMVAVVGFVDYHGKKKNGDLDRTNSVSIIQGGKVIDTYDKFILANGNHHEDKKYFRAGDQVKVTEVKLNGKNYKIGTPICEDIWDVDHEKDIVKEMKEKGADLILCANYSYFHYGKQEARQSLLEQHAKENKIPIAYVNSAGVGDIVKNIMVYDGGSLAYNAKGECVAELKRFAKDFKVVDLETDKKVETKTWEKYEEIYQALKFAQKETYKVVGIPNAQVHLSGGIDSSVVGAIVADAMGKENTVFITNPTEENSSTTKGYAQHLADKLGVPLIWNPTQEIYLAAKESFEKGFGVEANTGVKTALHAVLRTAQGLASCHETKASIVACGNHTEIVEGWANFHDIGSVGMHALIGDLTKVEVYQMAEYINQRSGEEVIPKALYDGRFKPAAELPDAGEDPYDYYVTSGIDAELIRNRKSPREIIESFKNKTLTEDYFPAGPDGRDVYARVNEEEFAEQVFNSFAASKRSVFKAAQAAPIVIISPRSRGFSNRETIINKYQGYYNFDRIKKNYAVN